MTTTKINVPTETKNRTGSTPRSQLKHSRGNPLLASLQAIYPVLNETRPLALGIHKAIHEKQPELGREELRLAMRTHTASTRYLKELATGTQRYDLDGNVAGEVTEEQRQIAATTLRERFKKLNDQRKAQEKAAADAERVKHEEQQKQEKLTQLAARFSRR